LQDAGTVNARPTRQRHCRELRDRDQTADIPIVLYTGKELPDGSQKPYDRSLAKTAGVDAILDTIQDLLGKRAAKRR
jgi:hypothetical protein